MDSRNSSVFHESDYHTPSPRNKRSRRLLERKSAACMCTACSVFVVLVIAFGVTVGLRVTGNRDAFQYEETLGDTRLIEFNPSYCDGIRLESSEDVPASLYLLDRKPSLTGWSNITLTSSFAISDYKQYIVDYGWYDEGAFDYTVDDVNVNYVTWNFHLNKGSEINVEACLETADSSAEFILIQSKSLYRNWQDTKDTHSGHPIGECTDHQESVIYTSKITQSDEYYFIFYSLIDNVLSPHINLTVNLHRSEYDIVDSQAKSCTTEKNRGNHCTVQVELNGPRYAVIQTIEQETEDVKYGDKVVLTWVCLSRSWVYVLIFSCPVVFFTSLFLTMYCILVRFWNRKLKNYQSLQNDMITSETNNAYRIVYERPEKKSINTRRS